jgi:ATP-dependent Clp protease ATP-binding subunit ClpA
MTVVLRRWAWILRARFRPRRQQRPFRFRGHLLGADGSDVLRLAQEEMMRLKHGSIEPGHLLLGAVRVLEGLYPEEMEAVAPNIHLLRRSVRLAYPRDPYSSGGMVDPEGPTYKAIDRGIEVARRAGAPTVGAAHIAVGFLDDEAARTWLANAGVDLDEFKRLIERGEERMLLYRQGEANAAE